MLLPGSSGTCDHLLSYKKALPTKRKTKRRQLGRNDRSDPILHGISIAEKNGKKLSPFVPFQWKHRSRLCSAPVSYSLPTVMHEDSKWSTPTCRTDPLPRRCARLLQPFRFIYAGGGRAFVFMSSALSIVERFVKQHIEACPIAVHCAASERYCAPVELALAVHYVSFQVFGCFL